MLKIVRLNTALGTIRAELNKKQLTNSSIQSQQMETLNVTVTQLQTALSLERDHVKELTREKDALVRETLDLKRQVKYSQKVCHLNGENNFIRM